MKDRIQVILAFVLVASGSIACLHPPRDYPGKLGSKIQEYLFYKTGDFVHMVSNQRIQSTGELPSEIAWVIPVPSVPTEYYEESDSLFQALFKATEKVFRLRAAGKKGFEVHETVYVGKYEIKPLEVIDTASGHEINEWLYQNGFSKVPYEGLKYYLKPHACFLAIKVRGLTGKDEKLRPLHVVYKAKEVRVPLKFFAKAGTFDVFVYTLSKGNHLEGDEEILKKGFRKAGLGKLTAPLKGQMNLKGIESSDSIITRYFGSKINSGEHSIEKWSEDPLLNI